MPSGLAWPPVGCTLVVVHERKVKNPMANSIAEDKCKCGHARNEHYWELTDEPVPKGNCITADCVCETFRLAPDAPESEA